MGTSPPVDHPPLYYEPESMATYYVDGAVGDDGNAGTSEGAGNAWATIGHAVSTVAAGDKVYVKASVTYTENLTLSTVGATSNPIVWEGYTSTPGDGGEVTIRSGGTTTHVLTVGSGSWYNTFKNFGFRGAASSTTGRGVDAGAATRLCFKNCRAYENGSHGFNVGTNTTFVGSYAHGNGGTGFNGQTTSIITYTGCLSKGNGSGFDGGILQCIGCISAGDVSNGFRLTGTGNYLLINCTVDGDSKTTGVGFDVSNGTSSMVTVVNCLAYDCTTGFKGFAGAGERVVSRNNLVNACTTAYGNFATFEAEVTSAPNFVNEASNDYGLQSSSPAKEAGFSVKTPGWITQTGANYDIGAVKVEAAGGGGGGRSGIRTGGML